MDTNGYVALASIASLLFLKGIQQMQQQQLGSVQPNPTPRVQARDAHLSDSGNWLQQFAASHARRRYWNYEQTGNCPDLFRAEDAIAVAAAKPHELSVDAITPRLGGRFTRFLNDAIDFIR